MWKPVRQQFKLNNLKMSSNIIIENDINQRSLRQVFYDFHRKYSIKNTIKNKTHDLLILRLVDILIWLFIVIVEFLTYSNFIRPRNLILDIIFGIVYPIKSIIIICYASGAAAYGISIEIYFIVPLVITNCILAVRNCGVSHGDTKGSIFYMLATIGLFIGTELAHQNFKRFTYQQSYESYYQAATRAMLRPSVYLSVTILFLVSPGLRAVYSAARFKCPYAYKINNQSNCDLIDIERPLFGENDSCVPDFIAMVISLDQLRIIRDIALCSIAFYSMYNKAFLDITGACNSIHKTLIGVFFLMTCSIMTVSVDPFEFNKFRIYLNLLEGTIFVILIALLIFNLRRTCSQKNNVIMEANPTIFG
jgi:hypothetical protein